MRKLFKVAGIPAILREKSFSYRKLCLLLVFIAITSLSYSQGIQVSGTVSDENGEPLPGVTVLQKGGNVFATTDSAGSYIIKLPASGELIFSLVGFVRKEVAVSREGILNITLSADVKTLEDVVILGFGQSQKRIAQTGAIASVSGTELKQSPAANVMNALAGRLPGLVSVQRTGEPGKDSPSLFIRGRASLNTASTPLVTIDGVQRDYQAISLLDVNEIENITILKDASATALYGVKGANGVIIVTTRMGKTGKPKINVTVERAHSKAVELPKFLDAYQTVLLYNEAYKNDNPAVAQPYYSAEAVEAFRTGSDPMRYANVDYVDALLKPAQDLRANFNITGGSEMAKYFVNIGYLDQGGIYNAEKNDEYDPNARYKRYNFRSNIDITFDEDFSIGLKLNGSVQNINRPYRSIADIFYTALTISPTVPISYPIGYYAFDGQTASPFWVVNQSGYAQEYNSALSGMLTATRKLDFITEGLSIKGNYSFDGYYNNSLLRNKEVPYARYIGSGDFNDPANYTLLRSHIPLSAPTSSFTQNRNIWMDMSLNYLRRMGNHEVSGLLLANRTQAVAAVAGQSATNAIPYVSQGLVLRAVYNFKDKYFAEFNAGYNGTDNFSPDKRYGFFPAFSAAWLLTKEKFLENTFLDHLKLRVAYGLTGDDQIPGRRWLFYSEYVNSGSYPYGASLQNVTATLEGAMANRNVSWQISAKTNVGLELKVLQNKLGLNIDLFHEYRYNQLIFPNSVPGILGMTGSNLPPINEGKVENKGFEVELTYNNNVGALSYFLNVNTALARNKIIFMDEEPKKYPWLQRTGRPIGQYFGYTAIGFFQNEEDIQNSPTQFGNVVPGDLKYKDLNEDGIIDGNDMGYIGKGNVPELFYGISGGVNWKNFDISFLFQGAGESYRNNTGAGYWEFFNGGKVTEAHLGRWTPETAATATYPTLHSVRNSNNHRESTFYLENVSYVRLKNAEIGYTINKPRITRNLGFNSARIYVNGQNLYTWADTVFDPELTGSTTTYPVLRSFNFGLALNF